MATTSATRDQGVGAWGFFAISVWIVGYVSLMVFAVVENNGNVAAAVVVVPILTVLTIFLARHFARLDGDRTLFALVMAGMVIKFLGAGARYWFAFVTSGGSADAQAYHEAGSKIAPFIRAFDFGFPVVGKVPGTGFLQVFTGSVYAVFGSSRFAGFFVFAWLSFLGVLLFWRAFKIGMPEGNSRRYLILLVVLPSLVFWPSSTGKEAFMMLVLGMCAYGTACFLEGRIGAILLVPGIVGTTMLRPHMSILVYCGVLFALLLRKSRTRSAATPALRIFTVSVLLVGGLVLVSQATSFLGVQTVTQESIDATLTAAEAQTDTGGSSFSAVRINSPLDVPFATVTVLFRPFPFEAGNLQTLIAATEGLVLAALFVLSWSRIRNTFRVIRSRPYVAYSLGFCAAFIFAFSAFSNFGLLARERTQMLPLLLVLFALPTAREIAAVKDARVTA